MTILGSLKRILFGASSEPAKQVHATESHQSTQAIKPDAEIIRIGDATKSGKANEAPEPIRPAEISDEFFSVSRHLLKEATTLKREKKFFEACEKLREAYSADGSENLMIEDRLRLPMYLQLAGKNDEGWDELNRLNSLFVDEFSQPIISNQMRVFLRKEKNENATNPVRLILHGDKTPMPLTSDVERTSVKAMELQNTPMPSWMAEDCRDFEFSATLRLTTPLRVLLRHGEIYSKNDGLQPKITKEPWEGIWIPALKTYEEIASGPDSTAESINFFRHLDASSATAGRKLASDIGPILAKDYLPFLIAVRKVVEANEPIAQRIEKLRSTLKAAEWQQFVVHRGPSHVSKSTGADWIVDCFFPPFVGAIPKLPTLAEESLLRLGLDTPNKLSAASNETLLAIKGIGRSLLQCVRDYCASLTEDRDSHRLDRVLK